MQGSDILREYRGTGTLYYDNDHRLAVSFLARQYHDSAIELDCSASALPPVWLWEYLSPESAPKVQRLVGQTTDGAPLQAHGQFHHLASPEGGKSALFGLSGPASALEVGDPLSECSEFRFGVTNLVFRHSGRRDGDSAQRGLRLDVGGQSVRFVTTPEQWVQRATLKRRLVRVTSELCVAAHMEFPAACWLASDICDLLTLAYGTLISWVYCEFVGAAGDRVSTRHYPAVTRPYGGGLPLIDPAKTQDVRTFIVQSYPQYQRLRSTAEFSTLVRAFAEARGGGFMDTRALLTVSLIEYVLATDAAAHGELTVLPEVDFDAGVTQLRTGIKAAAQAAFPGATGKEIKQLVSGRARGFNWTALSHRLARTSKRLSVQFPEIEVEAFLRTRNDLVHRLQFSTSNRVREYLLLLSVLDRLILGFLQYRGDRVDVRSLEPPEASGERPGGRCE